MDSSLVSPVSKKKAGRSTMEMLIYDAVKDFANSFAAIRSKALADATYAPPIVSAESALAPSHKKKMQKRKLAWAMLKAKTDADVRIHIHSEKSGTLEMKYEDGNWKGKKANEPDVAFTNLPNPNPDFIFQGRGTQENIQSNRAVTEAQFSQNLKEAMTAGAKLFPSQDYSNEFAIQFERPRVGYSADTHADTEAPLPEVPLYNMGWSQMVVKINVPPVLLPGGADPNLNWPISFVRSCAISWVQEPRYRFFLNNMTRYASPSLIWQSQSVRPLWRDILNYCPFFGGMDIKSLSWRRYEWISPHVMPLVRAKPDDEGYDAEMETWYKVCDQINATMQQVPSAAEITTNLQDTYQWEYRSVGASDPVDYTSTNSNYSALTNYLYKDTAIPWMKMTHYAPSGLSEYQNPVSLPYGESVINDPTALGQYGFNFGANANPEVLFTEKFNEEVPVKGLDFSRGGKLGVPSVFFPNPIASKTELQTLFDTPDAEKDTQPFYYYCVIIQSMPYGCGAWLGMFDKVAGQKEVTTLPFNVMCDTDCELRFTITGNYMQFNNAAWNKLYSNMLSPAQIQSVPRLTLNQGGGYATMQLKGLFGGTASVGMQWWSHYFNSGDSPQMTAPNSPDDDVKLRKRVDVHPQLNVSRDVFEKLKHVDEDDESLEEMDCPIQDFLEARHDKAIQPRVGKGAFTSSYYHGVPLSFGGHDVFAVKTSMPLASDVALMLSTLTKRKKHVKVIKIDANPYPREMTSKLQYKRFSDY